MVTKSNWDDSIQVVEPLAAPGSAANAKSRAAAPVHDGFVESEVGHHGDDDDVIEVRERPRSNSMLPKILVGVLVLVALAVVAYFTMRIMSIGSSKRPVAQAIASKSLSRAVGDPARVGSGSVLLGSEQSKSVNAAAIGQLSPAQSLTTSSTSSGAVETAVTTTTATATAGKPAGGTSVTTVTTVAQPPVATSPSSLLGADPVAVAAPTEGKRVQLNARVKALENENQTLRERLAREEREAKAASLAAASNSIVRTLPASATTVVDARVHVRRAHRASPAPAAVHDEVIIETAQVDVPPEVARLQLRGVYPRSGADMRAWLQDGESTRTVAKGDVINGARVLRVETDRVITDRGSIR